MAMLMLSFSSAWAQYVKVTAEDETVSWIEIYGSINGTNIEIYRDVLESAIDKNINGAIDLNEVWSESGGNGEHYHVTSIGRGAFRSCSGLTSVIIPNSVTTIGDYAFDHCRGLTSVYIPSSVTSIGDDAFWCCSGLISVTIGNGVTSIGEHAFSSCTGLTSVTFGSSLKSIGERAFSGCTSVTSVDIPSSVTNIDRYAFYNCSDLTSVTIGNGVTSIGESAFQGCSGLTSITIPNSVTTIGGYAFKNCSNLTSVTIGNGVTVIENYAFASSGLKTIVIEDGKETLSFTCSKVDGVPLPFDQCPIESLYIGRNISFNSWDEWFYPFSDKTTLTSVTIGGDVISIQRGLFHGCSGLTSVTIGNNVKSIEERAFSGCSALTSLSIGNSVTSIGEYAFSGCSSLTAVEFPNRVTSIGSSAFSCCSGLTSIDIPNRVTSIGDCAFSECSGLTSVTIPNSVTSIGGGAFYGCTKLESVYSEITNVFSIDAFEEGCDAVLYVPDGTKLTYIQTPGWNVFYDIIEMDPVLQNTSLLLSCNSKGSITINGTTVFTNKIGSVDILEDADNTLVFTPKENCKLEQVCFNGFDITTSVENNTLKAVIPAKSQMVVMFSKQGDLNSDGKIDISDVVALVNMILGN